MIITLYQANWCGHSSSQATLSASAARTAGRPWNPAGMRASARQASGTARQAASGTTSCRLMPSRWRKNP